MLKFSLSSLVHANICGALHDLVPFVQSKGCVHYIFASLFFNSRREHLSNQKNVFYFTSRALFVLEKVKF